MGARGTHAVQQGNKHGGEEDDCAHPPLR